jgi:Uma2 family endonuclease
VSEAQEATAMTTAATGLMTAEEFFAFVQRKENQGRYFELFRGKVLEMPPPGERHGIVCGWIGHLLWGYVIRRGAGAVCTNDTGLIVQENPDTVRGPDVMLFGESRPLDQLNPRHSTRIPLLAIEVYSPNDNPNETIRRTEQYLLRGVSLVWGVDPVNRTVSVHTRHEFSRVYDETQVLEGFDSLPGFQCRVSELFDLPGQQSAGDPVVQPQAS